MPTAATLTQWIVRLTGATQVILGVLFWTGHAHALIPLHMAIGTVFVIATWLLAGLAARAGVSLPLVLFGVIWGGVVIALGIGQTRLLPGSLHWVVEILHLLVGIGAMAIAARLASAIAGRRRADAPPLVPRQPAGNSRCNASWARSRNSVTGPASPV